MPCVAQSPPPLNTPWGAESCSTRLPAMSAMGAPGGQACPSSKDGQARDVSNNSGLQPPRRPNTLRLARGKTRAFHA